LRDEIIFDPKKTLGVDWKLVNIESKSDLCEVKRMGRGCQKAARIWGIMNFKSTAAWKLKSSHPECLYLGTVQMNCASAFFTQPRINEKQTANHRVQG